MLLALYQIVDMLLKVISWIIVGQIVLSWLVVFNVINTHGDFVRTVLHALDRITDPLYRPIRRVLPDFGGIDFSPMIVLLIIYALRTLLAGVTGDLLAAGY
jgi:YggT family protein